MLTFSFKKFKAVVKAAEFPQNDPPMKPVEGQTWVEVVRMLSYDPHVWMTKPGDQFFAGDDELVSE